MSLKPTEGSLEEQKRALEAELLRSKDSEAELKRKHAELGVIFEALPDAVLVADLNRTIVRVNPAFARLFGYAPEEVCGKSTRLLYTSDEDFIRQGTLRFNPHSREGYQPLVIAYQKKNGKIFISETVGTLVRDERGEALGLVAIMRDVTARKEMEALLRFTQFSVEAASISVFWIAPDGTFTYINQAACDLLGYAREELLRMKISDIEPEFASDPRKIFWERLKQEKVRVFETRHRARSGEVVPVEVTSNYLCYEGREYEFAFARNISKRKRAEERIRMLSQQLIQAYESERRMISRELHDRVAQDLSASKITCDMLLNRQSNENPETKKLLAELSRRLERSIMTVRDLSYDLRPPGLDHIGLVQTLFEYCQDFSQKHGIEVDFKSAGVTELGLDAEREINLYRLIQEGLTNIRKHAEATKVTIRLVAAFPHIFLRIIDNGKGFDVQQRLAAAADEKRMGLRSMEERVSLLGGVITIRSRPSLGTSILIKIPYSEKLSNAVQDSSDCR